MSGASELLVERHVDVYFDALLASKRSAKHFEMGLLIGQFAQPQTFLDKDLVLTAVRIPAGSGEGADESDAEDGEAVSEQNSSPFNSEDFSIDWIESFTKQIDRFLAGGLSVLGIYVVSSVVSADIFDFATCLFNEITLKSLFPSSVVDVLEQLQSKNQVNLLLPQIVLHVSPKIGQIVARKRVDPASSSPVPLSTTKVKAKVNGSLVPIQLQVVDFAKEFEMLKYQAHVAANGLRKLVTQWPRYTLQSCSGFFSRLEPQLVEWMQQVVDAEGFVASFSTSPNLSSSARSKTVHFVSDVQLEEFASLLDREEQQEEDGARLEGLFGGGIACVACVVVPKNQVVVDAQNGKVSTLMDLHQERQLALSLLKMDFIKSVAVRLEMMVEHFADPDQDRETHRLDQDEDEEESEELEAARTLAKLDIAVGKCLLFPQRGFVPWQSSVLMTSIASPSWTADDSGKSGNAGTGAASALAGSGVCGITGCLDASLLFLPTEQDLVNSVANAWEFLFCGQEVATSAIEQVTQQVYFVEEFAAHSKTGGANAATPASPPSNANYKHHHHHKRRQQHDESGLQITAAMIVSLLVVLVAVYYALMSS